ncbi:hypothetical protein C0991_011650 [Blastosporella zonata]|nr:hypothetical protein C0991_011650 [Blastosporella zonata]
MTLEAGLKFTFNYYHDAESVLWMAVWLLLRRVPRGYKPPPPFEGRAALDSWAEELLSSTTNASPGRRLLMMQEQHLDEWGASLYSFYSESPVWRLVMSTHYFASTLISFYLELEKVHFEKEPFWAPKEFKAGLYEQLKALLHKAADEIPEGLVVRALTS